MAKKVETTGTPQVLYVQENQDDFARSSLKTRMKAKFLNVSFFTNILWYIFRLVLLIGISYVVLYPFFTKIAGSFMSIDDFVDVTVRLIPKNWTLEMYKTVIVENDYLARLGTTFMWSVILALIQTISCCLIGYGLARFRFKGNKLLFLLVIFTMIIPHRTLYTAMYMKFRYFDVLSILRLFGGKGIATGINNFDLMVGLIDSGDFVGPNLLRSYTPLIIMSATGLAFKNGLYVFMMRQFFTGIPESLEESAYIDGSGVFRTFFQIIIPMSVPMMITIFLFAFCWQWTDNFYVSMFSITGNDNIKLLVDFVQVPSSLKTAYQNNPAYPLYQQAVTNTCGLLIIAPLVVLYLFCQNFLVQGIERSGITGE